MKRSEWPERREWLWKAMENEVFRGRVRNLGVSNFNIKHIEHLISHAKIQPLVNQICGFLECPTGKVHAVFDEESESEAKTHKVLEPGGRI